MEIFNTLNELINNLLVLLGNWGALLGCALILVESIIPVLPLSVFITLNFMTFGNFFGFIISWICTIIGCMFSYYLFKKGLKDKTINKLNKNEAFKKVLKAVKNLNFYQLVIIIAIPFTPAFLVNIAAGMSRIKTKKFFAALVIGKLSLVYFWGYIGVSLLESIKDPIILLRIFALLGVVYIISYLVNKKLKLK